jgi:hypothetical protein
VTSVESPFPLSASAETLVADTDTSRPGWSCNSTPGLADQKDTDRLMAIMQPAPGTGQPRPAICPICGLTADNGILVRSELTATATYCDTAGHLWAVTWLEVA